MTDLYAWSSFVDRLWKPDCAAEGQDKQLRDGNAAFSTQTKADLLQKCSKEILQAQIVIDH